MPTISGGSGFSSAVFAALTPTENFAQKRQDRQQDMLYAEAINKMEAEKLAKVQAMEDAVGDTATKAAIAASELSAPDAQRARQYIDAYTEKFKNEMADSGDPYKYFLKNGNNFSKKFAKDFVVSDVLTDGKLNKITEAQYKDDLTNGRVQRSVRSIDPATGQVIVKTPEQAYNDFMSGKSRRLEYNGAYDEPNLDSVYKLITTTVNPNYDKTKDPKLTFEQFRAAVLASVDPKEHNMSGEEFEGFIKDKYKDGANGWMWNNNARVMADKNLQLGYYQAKTARDKADKPGKEELDLATTYDGVYKGANGKEGVEATYNKAKAAFNSLDPNDVVATDVPTNLHPYKFNAFATGNNTGLVSSVSTGYYTDLQGNTLPIGHGFGSGRFTPGSLSIVSNRPLGKVSTVVKGILTVPATAENITSVQLMLGEDFAKNAIRTDVTIPDPKDPNKDYAPKEGTYSFEYYKPVTMPPLVSEDPTSKKLIPNPEVDLIHMSLGMSAAELKKKKAQLAASLNKKNN